MYSTSVCKAIPAVVGKLPVLHERAVPVKPVSRFRIGKDLPQAVPRAFQQISFPADRAHSGQRQAFPGPVRAGGPLVAAVQAHTGGIPGIAEHGPDAAPCQRLLHVRAHQAQNAVQPERNADLLVPPLAALAGGFVIPAVQQKTQRIQNAAPQSRVPGQAAAGGSIAQGHPLQTHEAVKAGLIPAVQVPRVAKVQPQTASSGVPDQSVHPADRLLIQRMQQPGDGRILPLCAPSGQTVLPTFSQRVSIHACPFPLTARSESCGFVWPPPG